MSRNTTALLAKIGIISVMIICAITGFYAEYIFFFGGISQMYEAESWLSVEMIYGVTRMICAGPVGLLFVLLFSFLVQGFDLADEWRKG